MQVCEKCRSVSWRGFGQLRSKWRGILVRANEVSWRCSAFVGDIPACLLYCSEEKNSKILKTSGLYFYVEQQLLQLLLSQLSQRSSGFGRANHCTRLSPVFVWLFFALLYVKRSKWIKKTRYFRWNNLLLYISLYLCGSIWFAHFFGFGSLPEDRNCKLSTGILPEE